MDLCEPLVSENTDMQIETVINTHSHALLRYCHSILCDYHEAQDAVQITFIKAWQNKNKFNGGEKDLLNFLYKIAYNTCIDAIRKRNHRQKLKSPIEPAKQNYAYIPENIKAALMSLSPLDRAVTYSHAVDEIPFGELAKIYDKTAAALRKRYERARKKLSKMLEKDYPYYNHAKGEKNHDE